MKRHETIKQYEGHYHTRSGGEPDIVIQFNTSIYPNQAQIIDIVSMHGQKKVIQKSIGLSLAEVVELRDILQAVINNSEALTSNAKQ